MILLQTGKISTEPYNVYRLAWLDTVRTCKWLVMTPNTSVCMPLNITFNKLICFQEHFDELIQYNIHSYMLEATDIYTDLGWPVQSPDLHKQACNTYQMSYGT